MIKSEVEKKGSGPSDANKAAGQAWKPSALTQMLLLCQREADRIETWQSSSKPGIIAPPAQWDPRQRLDFELYRRLATLCHTVSLVDSDPKTSKEWRRLVKAAVGNPAAARAAAKDEPDVEGAE